MVELNEETIKELSKLCRIGCSEAEQKTLLEDLKKILNEMESLNQVDTEHVQPCYHVLDDMVNVMREDQIEESMPREIFLANAPSQIGGMIRVPTIIKQV